MAALEHAGGAEARGAKGARRPERMRADPTGPTGRGVGGVAMSPLLSHVALRLRDEVRAAPLPLPRPLPQPLPLPLPLPLEGLDRGGEAVDRVDVQVVGRLIEQQ